MLSLHQILLFKFLQEGVNLVAVLAHLPCQEIYAEGKCLQSRAMGVCHKPTG